MTDNEIIKANKCCSNQHFYECKNCPLNIPNQPCNKGKLPTITYELLTRQKAEIERQQEQIEKLKKANEYTKGSLEIVLKNKDDRQLECEKLINEARELIAEQSELIKQLKAENDELVKQQAISIFKFMELNAEIKLSKHEAYKEFAEKLKDVYKSDKRYDRPNAHTLICKLFANIDDTLKELTEVSNA